MVNPAVYPSFESLSKDNEWMGWLEYEGTVCGRGRYAVVVACGEQRVEVILQR